MISNYKLDKCVRKLDQGDSDAQKKIAQYWAQYGDRFQDMLNESRIRIYYNAACAGNLEARYWMGMSYTKTNPKVAQIWLQPLLDKNSILAVQAMQLCYDGSCGAEDDPVQYEYWLKIGANLDDEESQYNLGDYYYTCALESKTFDTKWQFLLQAEKWYIKAAEQGSQRGAIGILQVCDKFEMGLMEEFRFSDSNQKLTYEFVKQCASNDNPKSKEEAQIKDTFLDWYDERMWACDVAMHCACKEIWMCDMYFSMGLFYRGSQSYIPDLLNIKRGIYCFYKAGQYGSSLGTQNSRELARKYQIKFDEDDPEGWRRRERLFD